MASTHRIDELSFDLAFESSDMTRAEALRSLVVDKLLPLMESVFDQFDSEESVWRIDKLVVDIGDVTEAELPAVLVARLRAALEAAMDETAYGNNAAATIDTAQRPDPLGSVEASAGQIGHIERVGRSSADTEMLLAFLADGVMPWRIDVTSATAHTDLLQRVLEREQSTEAFLSGLTASPHRAVLLARLARQFASAQLQALLRRLDPMRAKVLLAQLREAGADLGDPSGLAAMLSAMDGSVAEKNVDRPDGVGNIGDVTSRATAPTQHPVMPLRDREGAETDAKTDTDASIGTPQWREPPSAIVPMRNRVTSALMGGNAGEIYDDWHALHEDQRDLLRSAVLHYAGYSEIREKIAAAFPLSLLAEMQALLAPQAAALTALIWNDVQLRAKSGADNAAQWSQWRRNWWRGAIAYLLSLARVQDARGQGAAAADTVAAAFDMTSYVAAALESAGGSAVDEAVFSHVSTLANGILKNVEKSAEKNAEENTEKNTNASAAPITAAVNADSLASLFAAIRGGAQPLQRHALPLEQLRHWVRQAVSEPSFHQAIVDHAAKARDRYFYYAQVLQALAHNRIVDLEEFASSEEVVMVDEAPDSAVADMAPSIVIVNPVDAMHVETPDTLDNPVPVANTGHAIHGETVGFVDTVDVSPTFISGRDDLHNERNSERDNERDRQQLIGRLAKALMKGDSALLYGDWDMLLHRHAPLLLEALRHYAIGDDILQRIAASFPESMLFDMAALLAPAATPAWLLLRDRAEYGVSTHAAPISPISPISPLEGRSVLPADTGAADAPDDSGALPTPEAFSAWKRGLWKAAFRYLLGRAPYNDNIDDIGIETDADADVEIDTQALMAALSEDADLAGLAWQRRFLAHWKALSVRDTEVQQAAAQTAAVPADEGTFAAMRTPAGQSHRDGRDDGVEDIDVLGTVDDLERLVEAHIAAHSADDVSPQQRQIFLSAIAAQAPSASGPVRAHYFKTVLRALLQGQALDLEEIADASIGMARKATDETSDEASDETGAEIHDEAAPAPNRISALISDIVSELISNLIANTAPTTGAVTWLREAAHAAGPELATVLKQVARYPGAVARLLDLLPASSWPQLAAPAPHSALQVQRMRRYADDVADMFAGSNRQLSASVLTRFAWRFLLPYLFVPDRIFDPARFTGEYVDFLVRESGQPAPAGLAARLRSQMGITLHLQSAPAAGVRTAMRTDAAGTTGTRTDAIGTSPNAPGSVDKDKGSSRRAAAVVPVTAVATEKDALLGAAGIHVANAGMVLAWPFLSRAWEVLELTQEGKFVDDAAAQRAAWLLQFAVDEQTAVPEYQLTLNKLLCGIPLQAPIVPGIDIEDKERALIEELLAVMISHWKTIGNTSIQGLRTTFLQREGYLSHKEDGWHLHVPKRTFDMLLDKLPWSITTIRLPWMEKILWVEWI
jgi:hypothetical protein